MKRLDHLAMIIHDVGRICGFLGYLSLLPFVVLVIFQEWDMLIPMASAPIAFLVLGYILTRVEVRDYEPPVSIMLVAVAAAWFLIAIVGALPFMLGMGMSYTDGIFEAMSGWTSTGFTMIQALDQAPMTLLFWRTYMQWIGGIGIIVFGISMRRRSRFSLFQIFRSEGKPEDLMPNLMSTGWRMWKIYIFLTVIFTGLVMLAGIPLWDAVNLVMVAIATGGFTLHSAGLAYYHNPLLEALLIPVMLAGAIPFKIYFLMYRGKMGALFRDRIVRLLLLLALVGSIIVSLELYLFNSMAPYDAIREGSFTAVAAICTCGLQIADLHVWTAVPLAVIALLIFIGGAMGSTAGGIKINRLVLAYEGIKWWFRRFFVSSRVIVPFRYEGKMLSKEISEMEISKNMLVIALYAITACVATILCLHLYITSFRLDEVLFECVSALASSGLTVGFITAQSPVAIKWIFIMLMWLGRLEIVPVIIMVMGIVKGLREELASESPAESEDMHAPAYEENN
ncbi:cation transporter [Methanoregula boonei 6A8]|jgi:trk system potassium uptake protein TrkH|uniref:Cation transporter n=1 Tax=Methanoregula boonei (strain DSM 21154 / JCM 14090 / 6A8) TaxID=456442 RepID=A7I824_METB6|nr:TrkH family potassium uptake protein [Methanoregula boonei]ABS55885.1 cation transporter [Methanoregula boonei 6A8]